MNYSVLLPYLCSWWTPYMYNAMSYWPKPPWFVFLFLFFLSFLFFFSVLNFFLNVGEFPKKKKKKRSVAKCCRAGPGAVLANFFRRRCLSCKYIYHFIKACATTKWAMPNSHHVMYLNVGCVCVRVCVTEAGRDLFMHNKSIWLIIEDVWNLFAFRDWITTRKMFYSSLKCLTESVFVSGLLKYKCSGKFDIWGGTNAQNWLLSE